MPESFSARIARVARNMDRRARKRAAEEAIGAYLTQLLDDTVKDAIACTLEAQLLQPTEPEPFTADDACDYPPVQPTEPVDVRAFVDELVHVGTSEAVRVAIVQAINAWQAAHLPVQPTEPWWSVEQLRQELCLVKMSDEKREIVWGLLNELSAAHPPTQVEPNTGADSLSQGDGAHVGATDNPPVMGEALPFPVSIDFVESHDVFAYEAHPPTSEWNDAIEACDLATRDHAQAMIGRIIRGLKR